MDKSNEELINEWLADQEKQNSSSDLFWKNEYPVLSLEDRKMVWLKNIWQDSFMQGNAIGENMFYMFTQNNYQMWKSKYADIDEILDFVIERLDSAHEGDKTLMIQLNKKLGRISY